MLQTTFHRPIRISRGDVQFSQGINPKTVGIFLFISLETVKIEKQGPIVFITEEYMPKSVAESE